MDWQPIETAPTDGTVVVVGHDREGGRGAGGVRCPDPIVARFVDGAWRMSFGDRWVRFEPQPNFWRPVS